MKILNFLILLFFCQLGICQSFYVYRGDTINRIDERGLKYGYWIYFYNNGSHESQTPELKEPENSSEGELKIIEVLPKEIKTKFNNYLRQKSGELICFEANYKNFYSVKNGWWIEYWVQYDGGPWIEPGEIANRSYYINGYNKKNQQYVSGVKTIFTIYFNDWREEYKGSEPLPYVRKYKEKAKSILTHNQLYYPLHPVSFSSVEESLWCTLGLTDTTYVSFYSNLSEPIMVDSIFATNKSVSLSIENDTLLKPFIIKPATVYKLKILFKPLSTFPLDPLKGIDSVFFSTKNKFLDYYKLIIQGNMCHVSFKSRFVDQIVINKSKGVDSLLIIANSLEEKVDTIIIFNSNGDKVEKFNLVKIVDEYEFFPPYNSKPGAKRFYETGINIRNYLLGNYTIVFYNDKNEKVLEKAILIE